MDKPKILLVTKEDVDAANAVRYLVNAHPLVNAHLGYDKTCPIAQALLRRGFKDVRVVAWAIIADGIDFELPQQAHDIMVQWDNWGKVNHLPIGIPLVPKTTITTNTTLPCGL